MICQKVWKTAKYQGKIREKSGNFEVDDKWQPCPVLSISCFLLMLIHSSMTILKGLYCIDMNIKREDAYKYLNKILLKLN